MSTIKRSTQQDLARKILAAIHSNLPAQTSVTLAETPYTRDALAASIQQDIDTEDAATNAKKAIFSAAATARARVQTRKAKGLRSYVENLFTEPNVIAEFGFTNHKPTPPATPTKTAAVEKRDATRKARHTMGKNQKAGVKGDVTGVVVTPVTTPAAPTPSPSPSAPSPIRSRSGGGTTTA